MDIFTTGLAFLVIGCAVLYYYTRSVTPTSKDPNFNRFQQIYLAVYMLAMCNLHFNFNDIIIFNIPMIM
jgi:hypothetical protein